MPVRPEHRESLWSLAYAPTLWAAHFTLCYVSAALVCQDAAGGIGFDGLRIAIGLYSLVAWLLIGVHGLVCLRRLRRAGAAVAAGDPALARQRFLASTGLLLSVLSAVAVLFGALPALYFGDCR